MADARDGPRTDPATAIDWAHRIHLLGGFQLRRHGQIVEIPRSSQRVLAFLALNDRTLPRSYVAANLWPDTTDSRACASLRTALWRLHAPGPRLVDAAGSQLALRSEVWVDVRMIETASHIYRTTGTLPGPEFLDWTRGELLPGFWDPWLTFERERLRQVIVNLEELLCDDALNRGDLHVAVAAALAAVNEDPFRESSTARLIKAHLACGNRSDAVRTFRRHAALVQQELGIWPSLEITSLVAAAEGMSA